MKINLSIKNILNFILFLSVLLVAMQNTFTGSCFAEDPPFNLPKQEDLSRITTAVIQTNRGTMRFILFPDIAPWHVANFKYLSDKGFYRGLSFNEFTENYIIQGGAPHGENGPGYSLPNEFSEKHHVFGTLGMARRRDVINPERRSNGSQFHILLTEDKRMDGVYTIFGQLIDGAKTLTSLRKGDTILDVKVYLKRR